MSTQTIRTVPRHPTFVGIQARHMLGYEAGNSANHLSGSRAQTRPMSCTVEENNNKEANLYSLHNKSMLIQNWGFCFLHPPGGQERWLCHGNGPGKPCDFHEKPQGLACCQTVRSPSRRGTPTRRPARKKVCSQCFCEDVRLCSVSTWKMQQIEVEL